MNHPTSLDIFRPDARKDAILYDIMLILGASILIALSAQIAVPVPFSPVPITGQTFAILLAAVLLGSRRSVFAVSAYLVQGAFGIPVFAGAAFGIAHLAGPTGGYLIGFIPAAFFCGFLAERGWDRKLHLSVLTMTGGTLIIFFFGLIRLADFTGMERVLYLGFYPYIPGAIVKIVLAALVVPGAWKLLDWRR